MIRTIEREYCTTTSTSNLRVRCWYEKIPIREWSMSPEIVNINWKDTDKIPSSQLITVIFPDVVALQEYKDVKDFSYRIAVGFDSVVSFFSLTHNLGDINSFKIPESGKVQFRLFYQNFDKLKVGRNFSKIQLSIYNSTNATSPKLLESREINVTVNKAGAVVTPTLSTDKSAYYISYSKKTREYSGDTIIRLLVDNMGDYLDRITYSSIETEKSIHAPFTKVDKKFFKFEGLANVEQLQPGRLSLKYNAYLKNKGDYSVIPEEIIATSSPFMVYIDVNEAVQGIEVDKKNFSFSLQKIENKKVTGSFRVKKPSGVNLTATGSSILKTTIKKISSTEDEVSFSSLTASELSLGINRGSIVLAIPGGYREVVSVLIDVTEIISYNMKEDVIFCLDPNPMIIRQTTEKSDFVKMHIKMVFQGYGSEEYTINQAYDYVFLEGKVTACPGEDIEDFFPEVESLNVLNINESGAVASKALFSSAIVDFKIQEIDTKGKIYKELLVQGLRYIPGKKPAAYPFLTNIKHRRSYSNSLLSVSALALHFKNLNLGEIASKSIDNTTTTNNFDIVNICYKRSVSDKSYGATKIVSKASLSISPIPNPKSIIDVLFINQNLCPDWLSFSGEYEEQSELEHILSNNINTGLKVKAKVDEKRTLKLNTGWLFEEEVPLVNEVLLSKYCFIRLSSKWVRCIPISKKSLPFDSERNINSQIVEFQIAEEDER